MKKVASRPPARDGAGAIVIADNLSAHKSDWIHQLIQARGAHVEFLPPNSPDFNPIEKCWAITKTALRAVTPENALAWFIH